MTDTFVVTGGRAPSVTELGTTQPTYSGATLSTAPGPESPQPQAEAVEPDQQDPVVAWLTSDAAVPHRNHWVALNPLTGQFLGLADEFPHLRRWQAEGALIVFVDPPSRHS